MRKAQITLFIILGVFIISIVWLFILLTIKSDNSKEILTSNIEISYTIERCTENAAKAGLEILKARGGRMLWGEGEFLDTNIITTEKLLSINDTSIDLEEYVNYHGKRCIDEFFNDLISYTSEVYLGRTITIKTTAKTSQSTLRSVTSVIGSGLAEDIEAANKIVSVFSLHCLTCLFGAVDHSIQLIPLTPNSYLFTINSTTPFEFVVVAYE